MDAIDQAATGRGERALYWRHPHFRDMGLLKARFRRHRYDLHTHPTYVVALITGGCERVRIGRRCEDASANTVLVVNPEECHDGQAGCDDGWAYRTCYPPVSLMAEVARELGQPAPPQFAHAAITDPVLVAALSHAHRSAETGEAEAAEATMLLALRRLILVHADAARPDRVRTHTGSAQRVSVYGTMIEADPAARFTLADFADASGVTRFQVIRDFKQVTQLTPSAFIRNRRVVLATHLIEHGETLADAATTAGFADQSHLARVFKRSQGFTPGLLRKAFTS